MKDTMFVYHSMKTVFLGKFWFLRFVGKKGKSGHVSFMCQVIPGLAHAFFSDLVHGG